MGLFEKIINKTENIAVIGLGYVGLPLAIAFDKKVNVIGFDTSATKIATLKKGFDPTDEVGNKAVRESGIKFTDDENELRRAKFIVVAVPTPVDSNKSPDLNSVKNASEIVGRNLKKDAIVVFESTVYPGVTQEICIPIIEKVSGYKCGADFKVGYSPERINPGDKQHTLENICKIVSGNDNEATEEIKRVYQIVVKADVKAVSNIKTAEAIKVAENSQRDINIAFMNELAMVFDRMGIDTLEVVEGMNTKWNALGFTPGLVGGHCIGVDPYYFVYEAEQLGYHSQIVLAGRQVNDGMGKYVADAAIRQLILSGANVKDAKVVILGVTFKENCPDTRNSKVIDIIERLREYGINPIISDPIANEAEAVNEYGIRLTELSEITEADCVIVAVAHKEYRTLTHEKIKNMYACNKNILIDVKGAFDKKEMEEAGYSYWRL